MAANIQDLKYQLGKRGAATVTSRRKAHKKSSDFDNSAVTGSVTFNKKQKSGASTHNAAMHDNLHYSCNECSELFTSEVELEVHKTAQHSFVVIYQCPSCPSSFSSGPELESHVNQHALKDLQAEVDTADTESEWLTYSSSNNTWTQHSVSTTDTDKQMYPCSSTGNPILIGTNDVKARRHFCCVCGRRFAFPNKLLAHKMSKHPGIRHRHCESCKVCSQMSGSFTMSRKRSKHLNSFNSLMELDSGDNDEYGIQRIRTSETDFTKKTEELTRAADTKADSKNKMARTECCLDPDFQISSPVVDQEAETTCGKFLKMNFQTVKQCDSQRAEIGKYARESDAEFVTEIETSSVDVQNKPEANVNLEKVHHINENRQGLASQGQNLATYRCPLCSMAFSVSSELLKHLGTHSGYKDYIERCAAVYGST